MNRRLRFVLLFTAAALLFLSACSSGAQASSSEAVPVNAKEKSKAQTKQIHVTVDEKGYTPSSIQALAGTPMTVVFKRINDKGCGSEVVFPERKITKNLPLNEDVAITLTLKGKEKLTFTCGMGMYRGSVVVDG
ncbi:MAG: hypothetical protein GY822_30035 [Deltaproteobacteria bacterium]|nr:hypothetical protein [Deltaproteobacteria bacterium]